MIRKYLLFLLIFSSYVGLLGCTTTFAPQNRPDVAQFINKVSTEDNFDKQELTRLFTQVKPDPRVISAITKPAESKPWVNYRKIFLTTQRATEGAQFWQDHAAALQQAEKIYGVPANIIVAILGMETRYGQHTGDYPILTSLSTLAFNYPPRSAFFQQELEQYLLLTREQQFDPYMLKGSYAGAIGLPQFMPSSYRQFAVGFHHTGHTDLLNDPIDAIGSIGNYLNKNGWNPGEPIAVRAIVRNNGYEAIRARFKNAPVSLGTLAKYGIRPSRPLSHHLYAQLLKFPMNDTAEYWLGFHNLYVITRYNTSTLYAMSVYQLSEAIKQQKSNQITQKTKIINENSFELL